MASDQTTGLLARLRAGSTDYGDGGDPIAYVDREDVRAAVSVIEQLRRAWLLVIQRENGCADVGAPCGAKRCACLAEQDMLIKEAANAE